MCVMWVVEKFISVIEEDQGKAVKTCVGRKHFEKHQDAHVFAKEHPGATLRKVVPVQPKVACPEYGCGKPLSRYGTCIVNHAKERKHA